MSRKKQPDFQTMDRGIFIGDVIPTSTGNPSSGGFAFYSLEHKRRMWRDAAGNLREMPKSKKKKKTE